MRCSSPSRLLSGVEVIDVDRESPALGIVYHFLHGAVTFPYTVIGRSSQTSMAWLSVVLGRSSRWGDVESEASDSERLSKGWCVP